MARDQVGLLLPLGEPKQERKFSLLKRITMEAIVGPRAGEMLMEISTAMHAKLPLRKLSTLMHLYPIEHLAIRKAADKWLTEMILGVFRR